MTALLLQFWPYIVAFGAAVFGAWKIDRNATNRERAKQAAGNLAAAEDRLEMDREATAAERQAAGMTDDEARAEAMKWARR